MLIDSKYCILHTVIAKTEQKLTLFSFLEDSTRMKKWLNCDYIIFFFTSRNRNKALLKKKERIYLYLQFKENILIIIHFTIRCWQLTDKVGVPSITNSPNNLEYSVGSSVTLTCTAKGNPSPDTNIDKNINKYEWTFKANSEDNATVLTAVGGQLTLNNLQESQTGTYTCTAFNGFNGKVFNSSASQMLQIGKSQILLVIFYFSIWQKFYPLSLLFWGCNFVLIYLLK